MVVTSRSLFFPEITISLCTRNTEQWRAMAWAFALAFAVGFNCNGAVGVGVGGGGVAAYGEADWPMFMHVELKTEIETGA